MTAIQIVDKYIKFFEDRGHIRIQNSSLVPENDPTTLFTSSGMQPLVPYLLGEAHPSGSRLINVQNSFRAQDIDEIGDNRHITFFRMLGNWSLGDYFKSEQIPWLWEFLTKQLNLNPEKLYVSVFDGYEKFKVLQNEKFQTLKPDVTTVDIWTKIFEEESLNPKEKIFFYGPEKNWWSRSGIPDKMPIGEPGGPDSEVFYDFGKDLKIHENSDFKDKDCNPNCDCGRFLEIGNSVFMQYKKIDDSTFEELPNQNVDFGGGLERLIMATENQQDLFITSLFAPIIETLENLTAKEYLSNQKEMRIVSDHMIASIFIISNNIRPSNKEQGYILRRLLRRGFDNFEALNGEDLSALITKIVEQYKDTDEYLVDQFETIRNVILEERQKYKNTLTEAKKFISKKYQRTGDELFGETEISAEDAFALYTSHGLSPTQIESLGFLFDKQEFASKMEEHQNLSRAGATKKFAGGLADHSELTIKGHTATHLLHQALRDVFGDSVHQSGSNITSERLRFDYSLDHKPTDDEMKKVEEKVLQKISENLPVHFEMLPVKKAREIGAIGLFDDKYQEEVKVYFIGDYSKEFCGGPHVNFTGEIKSFKIIKEENLGRGMHRVYAVVE